MNKEVLQTKMKEHGVDISAEGIFTQFLFASLLDIIGHSETQAARTKELEGEVQKLKILNHGWNEDKKSLTQQLEVLTKCKYEEMFKTGYCERIVKIAKGAECQGCKNKAALDKECKG